MSERIPHLSGSLMLEKCASCRCQVCKLEAQSFNSKYTVRKRPLGNRVIDFVHLSNHSCILSLSSPLTGDTILA